MTDETRATHADDRDGAGGLTHYRADGAAHMVDVSAKDVTAREATATAVLRTRPDVVARIATGDLPKGEAVAVARVAGILAAKRTHELVPLCHPLPISGVDVDVVPSGDHVALSATVRTTSRTGVEMEALTAVTVAGLTVYDMIKAVDRAAVLTDVQVVAKSGGTTGTWVREEQA
ncbi:cyclic pyranopterin monophosphate synthase MoaC [Luteimicrobium subarcticum]|uniref:Cyclic pyranopterin monophosphate synthase n=1 Tax=Luteimicrobium subarcticum TaxID=620910 RepID=A0A2M8W1E6_9MICO|nr:cyclic pyranopterin monophosphate synthase MoaC [Luteimicrobium subarcticum]PJI84730.1 cyclic pyranopterin monophosphate synthase subunit MoaC [Luteimicrobium subarcticum]